MKNLINVIKDHWRYCDISTKIITWAFTGFLSLNLCLWGLSFWGIFIPTILMIIALIATYSIFREGGYKYNNLHRDIAKRVLTHPIRIIQNGLDEYYVEMRCGPFGLWEAIRIYYSDEFRNQRDAERTIEEFKQTLHGQLQKIENSKIKSVVKEF